MAPPATNDDGITTDDIDTAFRVLETVREDLASDGMRAEASTVNEAHYLVQQYDEASEWHNPDSLAALFADTDSSFTTQPTDETDHYWLPMEGDVMYDPDSNPKFGDGQVRITEVTRTPASRSYVECDTGKRSVAWLNPDEPDDAPVVKGEYVGGSGKEYKFPVTRLEK